MHRLQLAFGAARRTFPGYDVVVTFCSNINFFSTHSPKKIGSLEEIDKKLHSVALDGYLLRRRLEWIEYPKEKEEAGELKRMKRKMMKIQNLFNNRMVAGSHKSVKVVVADFSLLLPFLYEKATKDVPVRKPTPTKGNDKAENRAAVKKRWQKLFWKR